MGRNYNEARSAAEALVWLPTMKDTHLRWVLELEPTRDSGLVMAHVSLYYVERGKQRVLLGRWGEGVRARSPAQYLAGWLRGAINAASWAAGVDEAELVRLGQWEAAIAP